MDKMHLLVSGMSGMVGSRMAELYDDVYDFEHLDISRGVDITDSKTVDEVVSKSSSMVLIHLAAYTNVSSAQEQLGDKNGSCYQINVVGTENIAKACNRYNKFLIHVSTDFVFDGEKDEPYVETDTPKPIEWYGQTKAWAEEKLKQSLPTDQWLILRLAYPYQARPVRPDFLAQMMAKMESSTLPPQFVDHVITPTFTDDIAAVFDACVKKKPTGIYHCVGSSSHSDYEMAQMVQDEFGLKGEVKKGSLEEYLKKVNRPYQKTMRVSNKKLVKMLNIDMKSFKDGLMEIKKSR